MTPADQILSAVYLAVDQVNEALPPDSQVAKSRETPLHGHIDSLAMVNLVIAVEEQVADALGLALNLADSNVVAQSENPFRTIGTLVAYIDRLSEEHPRG